MKPFLLSAAISISTLVIAVTCGAYPLDGYGYTGITRLEGYRLAMEGKVRAPKQPPGALLSIDQVDLRLQAQTDIEIPAAEAEFTAQVQNLLGDEADRYAVAVLDLTNLENPRYAEHRGDHKQNVGSVGKIVSVLGFFQALADAWPDDVEQRRRILRETVVVGDYQGYLHFLDAVDGTFMARIRAASGQITSQPLSLGRLLFVQSEDGTIASFEIVDETN